MKPYRKLNEGEKHGVLTYIRDIESTDIYRRIECLCDCGNKHDLRMSNWVNGVVKSCGCLKGKGYGFKEKHGESYKNITAEYKVWLGIKRRCYNIKEIGYKHYGGRGIKMSNEWKNSYETFLNDVGRRPSKEYSIDRINVNGDYSKENCKWSTKTEQNNNTSRNRYFSFNKGRKTISELARLFKTKRTTFRRRLELCGWDIDKTIHKHYKETIYENS